MTSERTGKSHAIVWAFSPFLALFLYVATWPPIEIKAATVTFAPPTSPGSLGTTTVTFADWPNVAYWPLHYISATGAMNDALNRYWIWWRLRLSP